MDEQEFLNELRRIEKKLAELDPEKLPPEIRQLRESVNLVRARQESDDTPVEIKFSFRNEWSQRLFLALAKRYGLRPYRYRGQRHTTTVLKTSRSFVDETLWPDFQRLDEILDQHLSEVTSLFIDHVLSDEDGQPRVTAQRIPTDAPNADAGAVAQQPTAQSPETTSSEDQASTRVALRLIVPSTPPQLPSDRRNRAAARRKKKRERRRKRR